MGRPARTSGLSASGPSAAADRPAVASRVAVAAAELSLPEFLVLDVAELIDDDHLALLAPGRGDHGPDDSPEQAGEDGQDCVQGVVDGLTLDKDGLEFALGLDPGPTRRGS